MKLLKKNKRGFTLLEMMIVLVIAAIIAGIAMPHFWGGYGSVEMKGGARRIASVLRYAKSLAEARSDKHAIVYFWNGHSLTSSSFYNYFDIDIYVNQNDVSDPFSWGTDWSYGTWDKIGKTEKIHFGGPIDANTSMPIKDTNGSGTKNAFYIRFTPDGMATDDDGTISQETVTITNTKTGKNITITIEEATGSVSVGDVSG